MRDLISAWEQKTGYMADLITGSSGKLTAQILSGAPYDLFISADRKYLERLTKDEHITDSITTIAYGQLAYVWSGSSLGYEEVLSDATYIAIANPDVAPYGKSAFSYLNDHSLYDSDRSKLIYGENVAQVYQYVVSGAAEIGLTALSLVVNSQHHDVEWLRVQGEYQLVEQSAGILTSSSLQEEAKSFISYMKSSEASQILESYGYLPHR